MLKYGEDKKIKCSHINLFLVLSILPISLLIAFPSLAQQAAVSVIVEPIRFEKQTERIDVVGTAQAIRSVILYPAVADRVTEVNIVPGKHVSQGDALIRLDSRRQRVALDRAEIQLADADRTVDRLTASREGQAIPQSELDDAITVRDLRRVELAEAEVELEDRTVSAPFDGVLGITDIEPGDRITEQTAITSIDMREQLYIDFRAPEGALRLLEDNPSLSVSPWQQPEVKLAAKIVEIDSRLEQSNRTIRVRALIDNENEQYRPGTSFRVELIAVGEAYASVPEAALMWGATNPFIWLAEESRATRVEVQIKQRLQGRVLLDGDLQPGQLIITEGVQSVRQGQAVRYETEEENFAEKSNSVLNLETETPDNVSDER